MELHRSFAGRAREVPGVPCWRTLERGAERYRVGQVFRWPAFNDSPAIARGDTSWDKRQGGGAALRLRLAVGQRSLVAGFRCARGGDFGEIWVEKPTGCHP